MMHRQEAGEFTAASTRVQRLCAVSAMEHQRRRQRPVARLDTRLYAQQLELARRGSVKLLIHSYARQRSPAALHIYSTRLPVDHPAQPGPARPTDRDQLSVQHHSARTDRSAHPVGRRTPTIASNTLVTRRTRTAIDNRCRHVW